MIDVILLGWSVIAFICVAYFAFVVLTGAPRSPRLANIPLRDDVRWPKVSIVVPARNEERNIRAALQSLLDLDYPDYEILVVNDRSTDRTGEILDDLAAAQPSVRVEHIRALPTGWLGKNHALHFAAQMATGDYLLFTDADVVFAPQSLRLGIQYCQDNERDHLAATMTVDVPGWLMKSFVLVFGMFFLSYFRPWKVSDPNSHTYVGIGAFNLIRADVYQAIGGHEPIAMRPDDDVMLGKLVKVHGYRQGFVDGVNVMRVPWYGSMSELIQGLEKNQFSGVEYSIAMVVGSSLIALATFVAPFILVFFSNGTAQWLFAASAILLWALSLACAYATRLTWAAAMAFPLAVLLFVFIQWRTMLVVLWRGGLQWRDTFYSLDELKANRLDWPDADGRATMIAASRARQAAHSKPMNSTRTE